MDPVAAVIDALATWLDGITGVSSALRGWPEYQHDLDMSAGSAISIVPAGDAQYTWGPPVTIDWEDAGGGNLMTTWRLADLEIDLQVDLWAPYRAVRDELVAAVNAQLHDDLPHRTGLEIEVANHFGQAAGFIPRTSRHLDDERAAQTGEWRHRWILRATLGLAAQGTTPAQAAHQLRLTTNVQGSDVAEPDHTYDFSE